MRSTTSKTAAHLVAIVGGSGSGKSWLTCKLQQALQDLATCISQDNFYRDRSHLSPRQRARINFDHPRSIDWPCLEQVLSDCQAFKPTLIPQYDFASHTRLKIGARIQPRPLVLVEGLWLLRRPSLRRRFSWRIFLDCPARVRLQRRLARDAAERGRTPESIRQQFRKAVAPMHERYVVPQARYAHLVLRTPPDQARVEQLAQQLRALVQPNPSHP